MSARMSLGMLHARSHSFDLDPSRDVRAAETDVLLAAVAMHVRCPAFHSITAVIACEQPPGRARSSPGLCAVHRKAPAIVIPFACGPWWWWATWLGRPLSTVALAPGLLARPSWLTPFLRLRRFAEADGEDALAIIFISLVLAFILVFCVDSDVDLGLDAVSIDPALLVRTVVVILLIGRTVGEGVNEALQFWINVRGSHSEGSGGAAFVGVDGRCGAVGGCVLPLLGGVGDQSQ